MPVGEGFVESGSFRFRKLSPFDQKEVLRRDVARRRDQLKKDLLDFAADKGDAIATLREFDEENRDSGAFIDVFNTVDGKADVFDLAVSELSLPRPGFPEWKLAEKAAEMIGHVAGLTGADKLKLAAELCGLSLDEPDPGETPPTGDEADTYGSPDEHPIEPAPDETTPASMT